MLEPTPPEAAAEVPGRPMPRRGGRIALAVLLFAGLLVAAGVRYYTWCEEASGPRSPVEFTVPEGASGSEVVDALHAAGVIRCGTVSKWLLRRSGLADEIREGSFDLTTNMTPHEAFVVITEPPPPAPTVRLTIPEGYRLTQIADRVEEVVGVPAPRFLRAAASGEWSLPPYLMLGEPLEGFLFPETYEFLERGTTAADVIGRLLDQFGEEAASLGWGGTAALGLTPYETVIVASMVEEEARVPKDRSLIAAVIYNRLEAEVPLGIDATIQYIDPNPDDGLTVSDFKIDSPYNTRLYAGLPPTPIASPGLASLQAALRPADVDFLYYVLCGDDGHHAFSSTFERFLRDKARCLG